MLSTRSLTTATGEAMATTSTSWLVARRRPPLSRGPACAVRNSTRAPSQ